MLPLRYVQVDVFSPRPFSGNSLAVFLNSEGLNSSKMLAITRELRHFESIFITAKANENGFSARVLDQFEELPFAGHPIIGAAAVMHRESGFVGPADWSITLPGRTVSVTTNPSEPGYYGLLDQGLAEFIGHPTNAEPFANAFGLQLEDLNQNLPLEIISTGLRYLIIPVQPKALERARITKDISKLLATVNAQFAVLLDEAGIEIRHWNNDGIVEDVATGSAAGTIGAYRLRHGLAEPNKGFVLNQGRFTGRPSKMRVEPYFDPSQRIGVRVGGDVAVVGTGKLEALPA